MVTLIIFGAVVGIGFLMFKSYAKKLPIKRQEKEIIKLEAEIGDAMVAQLQADVREKLHETKLKRLKLLYQIRENDNS